MNFKKAALLAIIAMFLNGCSPSSGGSRKEMYYPDEGYADDKSDSWLQRTKENITINWYVDYSAWGTAATIDTKVGKRIFEKTGISINFSTPVSDDGSKLSTMIASGKLPDVITVGAGSDVRIQLGEDGYTYPLEELAKRYAPSFLKRLDKDVAAYFKQSDGYTHALPNHFYTQADLKAYEQQEGRNLLSNGGMLCRKDYLDAYVKAFPNSDPTTPDGFKEMCLWVKKEYKLNDANPTFLLDTFSKTGSNGVLWLQEYFCVPKESKDGKLLNPNEQSRNKELYLWLNDMYLSKIISSSNFTAPSGTIGTYISNGLPFAFVGSPQLYTYAFKEAYRKGVEYVPVVITNKDKEVPLLRSLAGNGWMSAMITYKCKHPDRVIKLFDYLWSAEGQSLFYGIENEDYEYVIPAGGQGENEKGELVTYKYGKIKYKDEVWQDIINEDTQKYGFGYSNFFVNPMYPRLTSEKGEVLNSIGAYIDYNGKAALTDYTYYNGGFEFCLDTLNSGYNKIIIKTNNISNLWGTYSAKIISASSASGAEQMFDSTVSQSKKMGSQDVLNFNQKAFQQHKDDLGIKYAWPKNDPNSSYHSLSVNSIYGNTSYYLQIPEEFLK